MKKRLLETLYRAKDYTLAVAEAMPEKDYKFKPEGAGWNFAELMNHIGYGIQWWKNNYLLGKETEWQQLLLNDEKKEVVDYLTKAFQDLEETCQRLSLSNDTEQVGFHATLDHVTHHRAQASVYLRCYGITPPEYIY
jgi:uncharacterized damage-inducible protein DinB